MSLFVKDALNALHATLIAIFLHPDS